MAKCTSETFESTPLSPGPWTAHTTVYRNGSVYIEDARGELIGWATDKAGHTSEIAAPDRRTPAHTLRNGHIMALSFEMLATIRMLVLTAPRDLSGYPAFARALVLAETILEADRVSAVLAPQLAQVAA